MRLTRYNMEVVTAEFDRASGNHWYKIRVKIPQLHLESPFLNTTEHAHKMIEEIAAMSDKCPHCNKDI